MPGGRTLLLLVLGSAACGGGAAPDSAPADAADTAVSAAPIPDSIPLVMLQQGGGISGATSELTLFRTGEVTLAQDPAPGGIPVRRWTIAPAEYEAVVALIASPAFAALDTEYLPENTCCDRITYIVTVPAAAGARTIRTMDAAQYPDALAELLDRLRALETTAPQ